MECPIEKTCKMIGSKWTILILRELIYKQDKMGFNELQKALRGISPKTLSTRLKELEKNKIITRTVHSDPLRVEYSLTESGKALKNVENSMKEWCEKWVFKHD